MREVVVVIEEKSKIKYFLSPNFLDFSVGDYVVFDMDSHLYLGKVCISNYNEYVEYLEFPLYKVVRKADLEDLKIYEENFLISEEALRYVKSLKSSMELDMNFVDAYYSLDKTQLNFSFVSDNRIDFREITKILAAKYKTRIELRQIGVRDKAKKIGGIGPCGLFLCCNNFLIDFSSVTINMAKNQLLSLNPSKINGICGRLMCCLEYENDLYTDLRKNLPVIGSYVDTPLGSGKVSSIDPLKSSYVVDVEGEEIIIPIGE